MAIRDSFLPEFEHEMASTRKTLERVPEDKVDWKPHDTSMPMGRLAGHVAEMIGFGNMLFDGESFDFAPEWYYNAVAEAFKSGAARMAIAGSNPALLKAAS